jgi:hypothetical protein
MAAGIRNPDVHGMQEATRLGRGARPLAAEIARRSGRSYHFATVAVV